MPDGLATADVSKLPGLAKQFSVEQVLVIGDPAEDVMALISQLDAEVRWTKGTFMSVFPTRLLVCRPYDARPEWRAVVNPAGPACRDRSWTWRTMDTNDELFDVLDAFDSLWPTASRMQGSSQYREHDLVSLAGSGEIGRVVRAIRSGDSYEYAVSVKGQTVKAPESSLTAVAADPGDPFFWLSRQPAPAQDIARTLTWTKLCHPLTDVIYSYRSSKTIFRAYQFKPVLKVINSDKRRLLIADEVGLGKTIEAGLVWNELEQRGEVRSALVICPSALRFKWQSELRERFDRQVDVLDRARLQRWALELEAGEGGDFQAIASIELLRAADEQLAQLRALSPRIDLVIVDEAHYMRNKGTRSNDLGELVSEWADALLFLSATPLNLHQDDLYNLLSILDPEAFPSAELLREQIVPNRAFNAAAADLVRGGWRKPREVLSRLAELDSTPLGQTVRRDPEFKQLSHLLGHDGPLLPKEIAQAKRHLVELHSLAPIFTRTRKVDTHEQKAVREPHDREVLWTAEEKELYNAIQAHIRADASASNQPLGFALQMPLRQAASCLPVMQQRLRGRTDETWTDEDELEATSAAVTLPSTLIKRPLTTDSKYNMFLGTIGEALEVGTGQALVFSFFRGTLEYLAKRIAEDRPDLRVGLMYGPTPVPQREALMVAFRRGDLDVLLCSEVGAEGLDFQFCNVLINYDLPWNPMRLEQRIGRLDRFGQRAEKIFIFNMQVPGTIEADILSRLYHRINIFRETIGDLEPILRDFDESLARALSPHLTAAQRERRILEIGVALEQRAHDIEQLSTTDSLMNGVNDLLIDGFEEDSPGGGRFVGRDELASLMAWYLDSTGGHMRRLNDHACAFRVTGGPNTANDLRRITPRSRHTVISPASVAAQIEEGISVTFDEREAIERSLPCVTISHPLIDAAVSHLSSDHLLLDRYGVVRVPGLTPDRECLAGIFLVEVSGLRPALELMCVVVDGDGVELPGVGEQLLSSLAHSTFEQSDGPVALPVTQLFRRVDSIRARILRERDQDGTQGNDALVDRRQAARRREYDLKLGRARETLRTNQQRGISERVLRMNRGRIEKLEARRDDVLAALDRRRGFSITSQDVAVLVLRP